LSPSFLWCWRAVHMLSRQVLVGICIVQSGTTALRPSSVKLHQQAPLLAQPRCYISSSPSPCHAAAITAPLAAAAAFIIPVAAEAAVPTAGAVPSALVAYGHYLGIILSVLALATERLTIKPAMTMEEEDRIAIADAVYGAAGLLVVYTGYLRVTEYGKGWEFYAHEPIFWFKLFLVAVMGASSFFPTTKIIQRSVEKRNNGGVIAPMSAALASRMTSIVNAELLAVLSIPLAATLMARGVGYAEWLPWQAGLAPTLLVLFGLGFKYVKEALDWAELEDSTTAN